MNTSHQQNKEKLDKLTFYSPRRASKRVGIMVARGVYVVKEDGLQFDHSSMKDQNPSCQNAEEYLTQFRYVAKFVYAQYTVYTYTTRFIHVFHFCLLDFRHCKTKQKRQG